MTFDRIVMIVSLIIAIYAITQSCEATQESKEANKLSAEANSLAKDALELTAKLNQPFLDISNQVATVRTDTIIAVHFGIINVGTVPVKLNNIRYQFIAAKNAPKDFDQLPVFADNRLSYLAIDDYVSSGKGMGVKIAVEERPSKKDVQEYNDGIAFIFLVGIISYENVNTKTQHIYRFSTEIGAHGARMIKNENDYKDQK